MSGRPTAEIVADLRAAIGAGIYRHLTLEAADRLTELAALWDAVQALDPDTHIGPYGIAALKAIQPFAKAVGR